MLNVFVGYNPQLAKREYKMKIEGAQMSFDDLTPETMSLVQQDFITLEGEITDHYVVVARNDARAWEIAQALRYHTKYKNGEFTEYLKVGDFVRASSYLGRVVALDGKYVRINADRTRGKTPKSSEIMQATVDGYHVHSGYDFEANRNPMRWVSIPPTAYYEETEPEYILAEASQNEAERNPEQETINLVKTKRRNA
jgi:hypothetical protein